MAVEDIVKEKIRNLIQEAQTLRQGNEHGQVRSDQHLQQCVGWIAAALNVVQLVVSDPQNAYRKRPDEIGGRKAGYSVQHHVGEFSALLESLIHDIDLGLLASVADRARAETFDNFLDHAKAYLGEGKKQESGIIAGVVFEDSIRGVCRNNGIEEAGQKLDSLIIELVKKNIISQTKAKRARVAAHVRTKATHAQWEEFDEKDVGVTIDFTEELILDQLDK